MVSPCLTHWHFFNTLFLIQSPVSQITLTSVAKCVKYFRYGIRKDGVVQNLLY